GYVLLVGLALLVLWDGKAGIPASFQNPALRWLGANWVNMRVWYILGIGLFTGLGTMGYRGWEARTMLWATWCTALFFQIFSGGDWMKGFRWFSLATVPQFTLIGVGLYALAELIPKAEKRILGQYPAAVLYASVGTVALICANIPHSYDFAMDAETAVRDVHQRVRYMTGVQKKLGLDQVTLLDVDMGAHLWYTDWTILDIAGLVDVPDGIFTIRQGEGYWHVAKRLLSLNPEHKPSNQEIMHCMTVMMTENAAHFAKKFPGYTPMLRPGDKVHCDIEKLCQQVPACQKYLRK
ncbi:MAG TPA: hypothetical protein PKY30_27030, partial [Myxococcota bacterium]|nr:hypothetical protein [Myxococcota bacterium]